MPSLRVRRNFPIWSMSITPISGTHLNHWQTSSPLCHASELRKLAWRGIPASYRPICWRLMCGLLPTSRERRSGKWWFHTVTATWTNSEATLAKKRAEYWKLVDRYFKLSTEDSHKDTYHQIKIDIPRTNPSIGLYQQAQIQVWKVCFQNR